MKVTLAFSHDGEAVSLISAYDEFTYDEWSGVPDFHKGALSEAIAEGEQVREVTIALDYRAVEEMFDPVELVVDVLASGVSTEGDQSRG